AGESQSDSNDHGSLRDLGPLSARKSIQIATFVDPSVDEVTLDRAKLRQVLYNYLSNAIKFTLDRGHIKVSAVASGPAHFRVQVEDSGIGITPEDTERL